MNQRDRAAALGLRAELERGGRDPSALRAALGAVPPLDRDAWIDLALALGSPPDDGPALPPGGVPYLPCPVDALLRLIDRVPVTAADLIVDVGSGVGRAAAVLTLLTGAAVVGVEVQPALVSAARALTARLGLSRTSFIEGDAATLPAPATAASIYLLYCPFSGARLDRLLAQLGPLARARDLRVCCVDLPLPPCRWLQPASPPDHDLTIYRSVGSATP